MPKLVRNSSATSRSGERSRPYARSVTLISAIALSSCVGTIDMLDHRQSQGKKRGRRAKRRHGAATAEGAGRRRSAPHLAIVGGRDALDQLGIDRRGAQRLELDAHAAVGLRAQVRGHLDPVAVAAQGPGGAVLLVDANPFFEKGVAGGGPRAIEGVRGRRRVDARRDFVVGAAGQKAGEESRREEGSRARHRGISSDATFVHVLSGLNVFIAFATCAVFGPKSFW